MFLWGSSPESLCRLSINNGENIDQQDKALISGYGESYVQLRTHSVTAAKLVDNVLIKSYK